MNKQRTFVNPFSDAFMEHWQLWKDFKFEEWGFVYKGVISEQTAIQHLCELSEGEEEKALKILRQSMRRKWQGFWPLKETTHGTKQSKSAVAESRSDKRSEVQAELAKRFNKGGQTGNSDYLKAV